MSMDWKRRDKIIYEKTVHWFQVIEKVLKDPAVRAENVYNFDDWNHACQTQRCQSPGRKGRSMRLQRHANKMRNGDLD